MSKETLVGGREPEGPREGLEAVVALRRLAEMLEAAHVENAIATGWSWAEISEVLGVSRQAVHKKHARRIKAKFSGGGPGEEGR